MMWDNENISIYCHGQKWHLLALSATMVQTDRNVIYPPYDRAYSMCFRLWSHDARLALFRILFLPFSALPLIKSSKHYAYLSFHAEKAVYLSVQQFRCSKIEPLVGHTFFTSFIHLVVSFFLSFWHCLHPFCSAHQLFFTPPPSAFVCQSVSRSHALSDIANVCLCWRSRRDTMTVCMSVSNA